MRVLRAASATGNTPSSLSPQQLKIRFRRKWKHTRFHLFSSEHDTLAVLSPDRITFHPVLSECSVREARYTFFVLSKESRPIYASFNTTRRGPLLPRWWWCPSHTLSSVIGIVVCLSIDAERHTHSQQQQQRDNRDNGGVVC